MSRSDRTVRVWGRDSINVMYAAASGKWRSSRSDPQICKLTRLITAAGKNDCAAEVHSCAGQSTKKFDKTSFVHLPNGACAKLASGSTLASK